MEVKVTLHDLVIKDPKTGEAFTVRTLRTAKDIAEYIDESEKDEIVSVLEAAVIEALHR
jgi:hypothetical protein